MTMIPRRFLWARLALAVLLFSLIVSAAPDKVVTADLLAGLQRQLLKKDDILAGRFPLNTVDGRWTFAERPNWFSGFTGGELWLMYDMTRNEELKKRALAHADRLLQYANLDNTHDLGFIFLPTCVPAYQRTRDKKYREAAISAARMLAQRFNPAGNFVRAWGKLGTDDQAGWAIIDTMMNLELLFWAADATGERNLYEVAYKHAITTMNQHVRANYSSYHVVEFDTTTGAVLKRRTHQGNSDESTWARGQAWGIYGFANAYRRTRDQRFLTTAQRMAGYFLTHLPKDSVPNWDLDLKSETVQRDTSAGAIASSGLALLSELVPSKSEARQYADAARKILLSLTTHYMFTSSRREREEGLLLHGVYNFPQKRGVDESYPAGDYYFMEAINRQWTLEQKTEADLFGRTDASIRAVLKRAAAHQVRSLKDGDYMPVDSVPAAAAARTPEGISWSYPWGVTLYGVLRSKDFTGDRAAERFVLDHNLIAARYYAWLSAMRNKVGNSPEEDAFMRKVRISGLMRLGSLDSCGAMGNQMLEGMLRHPDQVSAEQKEVVARIADWISNKQGRLPDGTLWRPESMGGTIWIDDLYMGAVFLARWSKYTGERKHLDDAARNIINMAQRLQDTDGVWYHGFFVNENKPSPFKWGRGNGWVMVATIEVLSAMPENHSDRGKLLDILRRHVAGVEKLQASSGMWRQVLDYPELWEETSCTAMFAYGIARAVNRGWIPAANIAVARKAFEGICRNITPDGAVNGTCEGTNIGTDLDFYFQRGRPDDDLHGRGVVLLAGAEILQVKSK
jgi:rhamnogalacturonyl hydrolase YesR